MKTIAEQMAGLAAFGREMAELKEELRLAISGAGGELAPGDSFRLYPERIRGLGAELESMELETAAIFESVRQAANASLAAGLMRERLPDGLPFAEYCVYIPLFGGRFLEWRGHFEDIRQAICDMGVDVMRDEPFSAYAAGIRQIRRGGADETDMAVKGAVGVVFTDGTEWADGHERGIASKLRAAGDADAGCAPYLRLGADDGAELGALGALAEAAGTAEARPPEHGTEERIYLAGRLSPSETPALKFTEYRGVNALNETGAGKPLAVSETAAGMDAEYVYVRADETMRTQNSPPLRVSETAGTGGKP